MMSVYQSEAKNSANLFKNIEKDKKKEESCEKAMGLCFEWITFPSWSPSPENSWLYRINQLEFVRLWQAGLAVVQTLFIQISYFCNISIRALYTPLK
jgi:hypothetical protein